MKRLLWHQGESDQKAGDRLHFNAQGAQTLGQRIYEILKTQ